MIRLPRSRAEVERKQGYFDNSIWMGFNLDTHCKECDGTGYMITDDHGLPLFGVFGDLIATDDCHVVCCPTCNAAGVYPRNVCHHCANRSYRNGELPPLGNLYRGQVFSTYHERIIPFNGYLCEQCADTEDTEGCGHNRVHLRLIR